MRKLTYFVAVTLDGFIAGPDGQYDFFPFAPDSVIRSEFPETVPAHAWKHLGMPEAPNRAFDTVVMGRGAFEPGLREGITSPYPHLRQYVFSRSLTGAAPDVRVLADDPVETVRGLKQQGGLDIWLCGGSKLAGTLYGEIDRLIIKRYPVAIGSGLPLFQGPFAPARFVPAGTRTFDSGMSLTTYDRA